MHKVLFVTSEAHPLAKTGGLGDVCGSLPSALQKVGNDVRVLLPAYPSAKRSAGSLRAVAEIPVGFANTSATLLEGVMPGTDIALWLVDFPPAYARDGHPYLDSNGQPWHDNAQRFALLCYVATALATARTSIGWLPDVVHCHDWQTGLIPALLARYSTRPGTVFTIHNLAYQGLFPGDTLRQLDLPPDFWSMHALEFHGHLSFMKGGLVFADQLTTVSPTYAREIQTPEFGYGLDGLLRHRTDRLSGVLNGIDTDAWDPSQDPHIAQHYSPRSFARKQGNKTALQQSLGFATDPECPIVGMIGRMVEQKGFDLALGALGSLLEQSAQVVVLGSGDGGLEDAWRDAQRRHPEQIAVHIGYSEPLAHQIEAGADLFLMPSRFEPCGLNQMYSQRYGTIPIVRRIGGLADTVVDASALHIKEKTATGIVFDDASVGALDHAIRRALTLYRDKATRREVALAGMRQDFSWQKSAADYSAIYHRARSF